MDKDKMMDGARDSYRSVEAFLEHKEDDSMLVIIGKILLRIIGIFIMILLSPFLLVGLFIAFIAVF